MFIDSNYDIKGQKTEKKNIILSYRKRVHKKILPCGLRIKINKMFQTVLQQQVLYLSK